MTGFKVQNGRAIIANIDGFPEIKYMYKKRNTTLTYY